MKYILQLFFIVFFSSIIIESNAQTLIINPNTDGGFELGNTFAANGWSVANNNSASTGNNWYLTSSTLQTGNYDFIPTGSRAAYISQFNNGNWSYNFNQYSTTHIFKDVSFPAGQSIIKLKFRWNGYGEGPIYDVLYVYSCPNTLTPVVSVPTGTSNNTSGWSGTGTSQLHATLHSTASWSGNTAEITLPASFAGTNRKLVFTWKNGSTLGNQPPAAIDSIWLFSDCPHADLSLQNLSQNCDNNINIQASVINPGGSFQWFVNNVLQTGFNSASFQSNTVPSGSTVRCIYSMNNVCGYKDTADILVQYGLNLSKTDTLAVCSAELPTVWRGITIPVNALSNNNYATVQVPAPGGCDSTITLRLLVTQSPPAVTEQLSVCRWQLPLVWRGITIPLIAQSNVRYDTAYVPNATGCDSTIYLDLKIHDHGVIVNNILTDCKAISFNGNTYYEDTVVSDTLFTTAGCDSIVYKTQIQIKPFELSLVTTPARYLPGNNLTLKAIGNTPNFNIISWTPSNLFPNQTAYTQNIIGPNNAQVQVIAQNGQGCKDTANLSLTAVVLDKTLDIPNAFTPNGDGKNDVFRPYFKMDQDYSVVVFQIYNRWGQSVYSSSGLSANAGWDGNYANGKKADAGLYIYKVVIRFLDGSEIGRNGELHLIR